MRAGRKEELRMHLAQSEVIRKAVEREKERECEREGPGS